MLRGVAYQREMNDEFTTPIWLPWPPWVRNEQLTILLVKPYKYISTAVNDLRVKRGSSIGADMPAIL